MNSSSPFKSPDRAVIPASSPVAGLHDDPITICDSSDDSQASPYFTQPTQVVNRKTLGASKRMETQPTQIVDRPVLGPYSKIRKSSPAKSQSGSEIEVPASSPFQKLSRPSPQTKISSFMAPAGTFYRRPVNPTIFTKTAPKSTPEKRKHNDVSDDELNSSPRRRADSSSPERPARGDIQRSSFQRQAARPAEPVKPTSAQPRKRADQFNEKFDARIQQLANKIRKELKGIHSLDLCANVLKAYKGNYPAALRTLSQMPPRASPAKTVKSSSASSLSSAVASPSQHSRASSKSSEPPRSPSPPPKRRRLVRGRNPKTSTGSSQDQEPTLISAPEKAVEKNLVGSKRTAKILQYLNFCSVESLTADARIKKDEAKHMISKRPFRTSDQVKAVSNFKLVRGKKVKQPLGEDVFDELVGYMKRLDAIDRIVQYCDTQGYKAKTKMALWKMDRTGRVNNSAITPGPILPHPKEPKALQGHCTMQPYQLFGMNWMWQIYSQGLGGILADDMGLGKTCEVVSFLALLKDMYNAGKIQGKKRPNLVVVPPSVLKNWALEFKKFAPDLSVITYTGSPEIRDEIAYQIKDAPEEHDAILTSYSQMNRPRDANAMNSIGINAAIFDEGHQLKNPNAKIYNDLIRIEADWKLILTGTPIQNNIMEMMSLLKFLSPHVFQNDSSHIEELFAQRASLQEVSEGAVLLSDRVKRARSILEPFILKRTKDEVMTDMPAKIRKIAYCEMHDGQRALYTDLESKFRDSKAHKAMRGGRKNDMNNPWIQLRKAAIHPQLFRRFFDDKKCEEMAKILMSTVSQDELRQPNIQHLTNELKGESDFQLHLWCRDYPCIRRFDCPNDTWLESGKIEKLLELVGEFERNKDRALVFSRFSLVISILEECLTQAGVNYRVLQGETAVGERQDIVDEFNADESITVFLLTTKAGGTGLNLTSANKVVLFDQSDNPQDDIQAENRAHRMGQKREVEVVRLLSKGTIDELIYKACQKKLELAGQITGHNEDISGEEVQAMVTKMLLQQPAPGLVTPPKSEL
ncbi:ATP-dependent helicase fft2 [Cytospora mali]|uniref:ATP-dependent helicase fft2 n=1 Tax=Cytospora mali TaxID=578113 RepID=A0A194UQS6_CYTMA|nr:ATP-dependent helicase fft2 [Valsa mali var. pyri (nom. inval.)]